jgi:DNA repair protein RadC
MHARKESSMSSSSSSQSWTTLPDEELLLRLLLGSSGGRAAAAHRATLQSLLAEYREDVRGLLLGQASELALLREQLAGQLPRPCRQRLAALHELARRLTGSVPRCTPVKITSPEDVEALMRPLLAFLHHEEVQLLLLDTRLQLLPSRDRLLYRGTIKTTPSRIASRNSSAIRRSAACLIVCHNHPAGDPTPSPEDEAFTRTLIQAGHLLDLPVLDHLILAREGCYSFRRQQGNLWPEEDRWDWQPGEA